MSLTISEGSSGWTGMITSLIPLAAVAAIGYLAWKYLSTNGIPNFGLDQKSTPSYGQPRGGQPTTQLQQPGVGAYVQGQGQLVTDVYGRTQQLNAKRPLDPSEAQWVVGQQTLSQRLFADTGIKTSLDLSMGSWTRMAQPAGGIGSTFRTIPTPGVSGGLVVPLQSGRDTLIPNQIAVLNPTTGNAWGGGSSTMDFLYNSSAPEAVAWRARYG